MPFITMKPAELYLQLGQLLDTMPQALTFPLQADGHRWLARAQVLVEAAGDIGDLASLKAAVGSGLQTSTIHYREGQLFKIRQAVYNALARAEVNAPAELQGAFLPAGSPHDALVAVSKVLGQATSTVLLVDPYADANILTSYAVQAPEQVTVHVLSDKATIKPGLKPAVAAWAAQYGTSRPLEARAAPAKALHDRLIVVDGAKAWFLGQSFNALATRAPTVITRLDPETAALKIAAHAALWTAGASL